MSEIIEIMQDRDRVGYHFTPQRVVSELIGDFEQGRIMDQVLPVTEFLSLIHSAATRILC